MGYCEVLIGEVQVTLVGSSVFIFGGEDSSRRPIGDLLVLDLAAMAWVRPDTTGLPPAARSAHTAVAYKVGVLATFIFGSSGCLDPVHRAENCRRGAQNTFAEGP